VKRVSEGYFMDAAVSPPDIGGMGAKIKEEIMDYLQTKVEQLHAAGIEKCRLWPPRTRSGVDH